MNNLSSLSNQELVCDLKRLVRKECDVTLSVLEHLAEFDRRKAYVPLGYQSLFAYCTGELKYSEPATNRRIKAARCIREYSEVFELLKNQEVNLSTICIFAPILTPENKDEVLAKVSNQPKNKVEQVVAAYREPTAKDIRDSITPIVVKAPAEPSGENLKPSLPLFAEQVTVEQSLKPDYRLGDGGNHSSFSEGAALQPLFTPEERVKFTFSGSQDFAAMVEKMRLLLSHKSPAGAGLEDIFQEAMQCYIAKHDPVQKAQRSLARDKAKEEKEILKSQEIEDHAEPIERQEPGPSTELRPGRYIPAAVRAEVMLRDGSACTYVSPDGHRCGSKWDVELDHIVPFAKGGSCTASNIRTRCRCHNIHAAELEFGSAVMDRYSKAGNNRSKAALNT